MVDMIKRIMNRSDSESKELIFYPYQNVRNVFIDTYNLYCVRLLLHVSIDHYFSSRRSLTSLSPPLISRSSPFITSIRKEHVVSFLHLDNVWEILPKSFFNLFYKDRLYSLVVQSKDHLTEDVFVCRDRKVSRTSPWYGRVSRGISGDGTKHSHRVRVKLTLEVLNLVTVHSSSKPHSLKFKSDEWTRCHDVEGR